MYEYLHEDRQSFKFTKGLKVGAKAVFNAKLPLVCASYEKVSAEVSFSAEQTVTTAERSRWNFSETVTVRPNNDVKVTGFVRIAKLDAPFTCNVKVLDGDAFVELNLKTGTCWQLVMPLIAIMSDDERTFGLSGNLESSKAVGTYVKVVSTDLPVSSALTQA
jgi:hypothetical protein